MNNNSNNTMCRRFRPIKKPHKNRFVLSIIRILWKIAYWLCNEAYYLLKGNMRKKRTVSCNLQIQLYVFPWFMRVHFTELHCKLQPNVLDKFVLVQWILPQNNWSALKHVRWWRFLRSLSRLCLLSFIQWIQILSINMLFCIVRPWILI